MIDAKEWDDMLNKKENERLKKALEDAGRRVGIVYRNDSITPGKEHYGIPHGVTDHTQLTLEDRRAIALASQEGDAEVRDMAVMLTIAILSYYIQSYITRFNIHASQEEDVRASIYEEIVIRLPAYNPEASSLGRYFDPIIKNVIFQYKNPGRTEYQKKAYNHVAKAIQSLESRGVREPSHDEIAREAGRLFKNPRVKDAEAVARVMEKAPAVASLHQETDDGEYFLGENLADENRKHNPEMAVLDDEMYSEIHEIINSLDEQSNYLVNLILDYYRQEEREIPFAVLSQRYRERYPDVSDGYIASKKRMALSLIEKQYSRRSEIPSDIGEVVNGWALSPELKIEDIEEVQDIMDTISELGLEHFFD